MTEPKKKPVKRPSTYRKLTVAQKAEAAALWRSGTVTLEDLAKKYKKRAEAFSRLFKDMGIVRGEHAEAAAKKIAEVVEARTLTEVEETLKKIKSTRDKHFIYATGLAGIAFQEIKRAREAGLDISTLKDLMMTLKLAGEVTGNSRKELFAILDVEKYAREEDMETLPELTVRELTNVELTTLRDQDAGDDDMLDDMGAEMLPEDDAEGF